MNVAKKTEKLTLKPFDIKRGFKPVAGGPKPVLGTGGPSQAQIQHDEFDVEESNQHYEPTNYHQPQDNHPAF